MPLAERERILQDEYGIMPEEETKGRIEEMCNLSEGIWEKGIQAGRKSGRIDGENLARHILKLTSEGKSGKEISEICKAFLRDTPEIVD